MKKNYLLILPLILLSASLFSQLSTSKWQRLSGQWDVVNSSAFQSQPKSILWNYYDILNYNTIVTTLPVTAYDSIEIISSLSDRYESPAQFMISFAVTSESQSWFYHSYSFKFTGGFWGIDKVSFIYSDRLDKTKPLATKKNTFVNELASADCKVKYDKVYTYRVAFQDSNVILFINGEKLLSAPFPEKSYDGRIAISILNVKLALDKVDVKKGQKTVFEDDFLEDSIYVKTVKVQKVPESRDAKEKLQ